MHALFLDLVIGIGPWFVCLVCISFDMKVAYLILWAIMRGNAWLVVRESRHMPLWVIIMIRDMVGAYMPWIVLPCFALPSVAVICRFCRNIMPTGSVKCRPAIISLPTASLCAGGHIPLPVAIPCNRWCLPASKEAVLRFWQPLEEWRKENRGSLCMAVHFPRRFPVFLA